MNTIPQTTFRSVGIDVSKAKLDCVLCVQGKWRHKVFTNNPKGFESLLTWLLATVDAPLRVCMGATSTYWEALPQFLCDARVHVSVINPALLKACRKTQRCLQYSKENTVMNIRKNTRLTPHSRQAIWRAYTQDKQSVTSLAAEYKVGRPTIYRILKAARLKLLVPQKSTHNRFKQARYGMKRLAKVEREIEKRLKKQARRYNKSYPGEMAHFDTKRLPRLKNQTVADPFEYLFVAIDGYSRELRPLQNPGQRISRNTLRDVSADF